MKRIFKTLKRDNYLELVGVLLGGIIGIYVWKHFNNIYIGLISFVLFSIVLCFIINRICIIILANFYIKANDKYRKICSEDLRNFSKNVDDLLDLDKKLVDFLDKYSSGKSNDFSEKELNKQWAIHGKKFILKAKKILSKMNNQELLVSLLGTDEITHIVDIFEYFKPYKIDVDYLKQHPEKAKEYYIENLLQQEAIRDTAINDYYYNRIMELNYFDEIERFILSQMNNDDLIELANNSTNWYNKLYYYGYIKSDKKDGENNG